MSGCPHKRNLAKLAACPLATAALVAGLPSCDDGNLDGWDCAVDRGLDYDLTVARLRALAPKLVAECEALQRHSEAQEQRDRNMMKLGIR